MIALLVRLFRSAPAPCPRERNAAQPLRKARDGSGCASFRSPRTSGGNKVDRFVLDTHVIKKSEDVAFHG